VKGRCAPALRIGRSFAPTPGAGKASGGLGAHSPEKGPQARERSVAIGLVGLGAGYADPQRACPLDRLPHRRQATDHGLLWSEAAAVQTNRRSGTSEEEANPRRGGTTSCNPTPCVAASVAGGAPPKGGTYPHSTRSIQITCPL